VARRWAELALQTLQISARMFPLASGGLVPWGPDPLTTAAMMQDVLDPARQHTQQPGSRLCLDRPISMVSGSCTRYLAFCLVARTS